MKSLLIAMILSLSCLAQTQSAIPNSGPSGDDISGMYSFLQEGEFVQVNVDSDAKVTGFISRYGDLNSDRGAFLDHMFKNGATKGHELHFVTKAVHGIWFQFDGIAERGEGKDPSVEGYHVLKGKLTEFNDDDPKKSAAKSREVILKSFPQDALVEKAEKKD
jgi:hypothetical protein